MQLLCSGARYTIGGPNFGTHIMHEDSNNAERAR